MGAAATKEYITQFQIEYVPKMMVHQELWKVILEFSGFRKMNWEYCFQGRLPILVQGIEEFYKICLWECLSLGCHLKVCLVRAVNAFLELKKSFKEDGYRRGAERQAQFQMALVSKKMEKVIRAIPILKTALPKEKIFLKEGISRLVKEYGDGGCQIYYSYPSLIYQADEHTC